MFRSLLRLSLGHSRSPSISRILVRNQSRTTPDQPKRLDRLIVRLPKRLQPYVSNLRSAPISHIAAFLILHEITAIVPLFALFGLFHWGSWLPLNYIGDRWAVSVKEGVNKFERYFKKKGIFGFSKDRQDNIQPGDNTREILEQWETGSDPKYKILVEIGLSWAITKAMLPLRIAASLAATPWFAKLLVRLSWVRK